MMAAWVVAFLFTLAVELPVCWLALRGRGLAVGRVVVGAALATALTHPTFWFALPPLFTDYWTYTFTGEIGITLTEAMVLRAFGVPGFRMALGVSGLMNGASYLLGALV